MLQSQEYVGLLITAARRRLRQAVNVQARRYGLSAQEFWVLIAVRELGETSLGALAERQRLDLPTTSRVVARLGERALIKLSPDTNDRRRARISLTAKGAKLSAAVQRAGEEVRTTVIEGMTDAEQAALRSALHKVMRNLDRYLTELGAGDA